ncbi:DUF975 family protein [uncultured Ruminococcus sp.]|uniref:putative ABC transporter permease n=1 Tax=uncultured Ruminococcus sp. TaxID=165186 RepID=UPI000EC36B80|nr:DUF975 family protein [uncultured Ruminococcus sp.]HCJ41304.1 hypothetical protein [Ruminococcus sp.]
MEWGYKKILSAAFDTLFRKGLKAWIVMAVAALFFSLMGSLKSTSSDQSEVFKMVDKAFGLESFMTPDNLSVLEEYAARSEFGKTVNTEENKLTTKIVRALANKNTLLVQLVSMNMDYVKRNSGEVIGLMIVMMILFTIVNQIISGIMEIGKARFVLENRYQRNGRFRRIFAPFGSGRMLHLTWVYIIYNVVMVLWAFTIIGFFYKLVQYSMVPYLLAENPALSWKEARNLSKQMTKGYKLKILLMYIIIIPLYVIETIPFVGILTATPLIMQIEAEMYAVLRKRTDIDRKAFIEPAFDGEAFVYAMDESGAAPPEFPEYVMQDILKNVTSFDKADRYKLTDYIVMFFSFDLVGYLWEVGIHIYEDHEFVNRGMMYGPWIPIYGFGGVFIIFFLNRYKDNKAKLIALTMLLCGVLEYVTSLVLDIAMNASYWDYTTMNFNLNGRVCLAGLCAFAIGGFAGIYLIGPALSGALRKFGTKRTRILCCVLVAAFVTDLICCGIFGPNSGKGIGTEIKAETPNIISII